MSERKLQKVFQIGTTYVIFVPPGWLFAGTVTDNSNGYITMDDVVYLVYLESGGIGVGSVAAANTVEELNAACKDATRLPDGSQYLSDGILFHLPCKMDMKALKVMAPPTQKALKIVKLEN